MARQVSAKNLIRDISQKPICLTKVKVTMARSNLDSESHHDVLYLYTPFLTDSLCLHTFSLL